MPETPFDAAEVTRLIRSRRSTFLANFDTSRKVPDEVVKEALENACWAPNHGRTEPWLFTVYTGAGLQELATLQSEFFKEHSPDPLNLGAYLKLQENPLRASHVVVLGMKRSPKPNIPEIEDIEAVACAVQNLHLSLHAHGASGYWTTGGITYKPGAQHLFGLGEEDKLLGFFYIGYAAQEPAVAAKRAVLEEKVRWVE